MNIGDLKSPAIDKKRKRLFAIAGFIVLFLIGASIAAYPFWPAIKYSLFPPKQIAQEEIPGVPETQTIIEEEKTQTEQTNTENTQNQTQTPATAPVTDNSNTNTTNLLIIPSINVKIPIVEGTDEKALNKGAWRLPETSTPDKGSNTVITGHRWLYRPPSQKTFYLLDKVEVGDIFQIIWDGKEYNYKVIGVSVVLPTDVWVLNPTEKSVVTLITCTPLFSTTHRLVVKGELIAQ